MQHLVISTDGTDPNACHDWPVFDVRSVVHIQDQIRVCRMPQGTEGGQSTVMFLAPMPGGKTVCLELTMANFQALAAVMAGAEQRAKQNNN